MILNNNHSSNQKCALQFSCHFLLACVLILCSALPCRADDTALAKLFQERGIEGTIVISSLDGKTEYVHNNNRAETRLVTASTFKIPNSLIALEEGVIRNEQEVLKWDGKDSGFPACNKDQNLQTAFSNSCVWTYQELARRIGPEKYKKHLKQLDYGNQKISPELTSFWLAGDLLITPQEQIAFLKKLYADKLPYRPDTIQTVKKIMINEQTPYYTIRAKTGWANQLNPQIGWFVGYVEAKGQVWFFATNIVITKNSDLALRKEITMAALKAKGII